MVFPSTGTAQAPSARPLRPIFIWSLKTAISSSPPCGKASRGPSRKIQRLQSLYPEVRIRLWNRRDFERLLSKYGLASRRSQLVGQDALTNDHEHAV